MAELCQMFSRRQCGATIVAGATVADESVGQRARSVVTGCGWVVPRPLFAGPASLTFGRPGLRLVRLSGRKAPALLGTGFGVGALSGFFRIDGGFLIGPGLVLATGMPMPQAVATSLVAVTAFGPTTAATYAAAGLVDWPLAAVFISGGVAGSLLDTRAARYLSRWRGELTRIFACLIVMVAAYMLARRLHLIG